MCVRSLRLQRHLFLHVSPMRDGSGHRPRRPFSRGHSGEKSRLAPSPTGRGRSLWDIMSSRPECVGLGFIQQTSPGSSSKRPRVHSVSKSRRRGRGAGFQGAPAHAHSHTLTLVHTHPGTVPRTLSRVCARAGTLPRVRAHGRTLPTFTPARACVLADAHAVRSRAIAHMRVCVQTHTPAHSHTCGSTRDAGTLPAAGASAPTAVSRDLRLRSRRPSGALCPLSRGEGGGCTRRP